MIKETRSSPSIGMCVSIKNQPGFTIGFVLPFVPRFLPNFTLGFEPVCTRLYTSPRIRLCTRLFTRTCTRLCTRYTLHGLCTRLIAGFILDFVPGPTGKKGPVCLKKDRIVHQTLSMNIWKYLKQNKHGISYRTMHTRNTKSQERTGVKYQ